MSPNVVQHEMKNALTAVNSDTLNSDVRTEMKFHCGNRELFGLLEQIPNLMHWTKSMPDSSSNLLT